MIQLRTIKKAAIFSLVLFVFTWGNAYYEKVHSLAAKLALELLRLEDKRRTEALYSEIYSSEHFKAIGIGAWEEDFGVTRGNDRSFRHYYDPDAKTFRKGVPYYPYYLIWKLQGAAVKSPEGGIYEGALEWARRGVDRKGSWEFTNPFNWEGAIRAYDYTAESRREAYRRLGHVVHLLVDMAEPDHAANIPHAGSGLMLPESIDDICGPQVIGILKAAEMNPALKLHLVQAIILADIKLKNLLTKGDLDIRTVGFEGLIEDTVSPSAVREFFPGEHASHNNPGRGFFQNPMPIAAKGVRRMKTLDDYFNSLAHQSKNAATGKKEFSLALGCAELFEFLEESNFVQALELLRDPVKYRIKDYGKQAVETFGTKGKLYIVPVINRKDQSVMSRFYGLARELLTAGVELSAGLMEHFHDLVNPPPFVQSVKIEQEGEKVYYAFWKDTIVPQSGSKTSPVAGLDYDIVANRLKIVEKTDRALEAGKKGAITIEFGPHCGDFREPIDAGSVNVAIGETSAVGKIEQGRSATKWAGEFEIPVSLGSASGKTLPVIISAKDGHVHFDPQSQSFVKGFGLDTDPKTPAKVWCNGINSYIWNGFEKGEDKNHQVPLKGVDLEVRESGRSVENKVEVTKTKGKKGSTVFFAEPIVWKNNANADKFFVNYCPRFVNNNAESCATIFYIKEEYVCPIMPELSYVQVRQADDNNIWSARRTYPNNPKKNWENKGTKPSPWLVCPGAAFWLEYVEPSDLVPSDGRYSVHLKARDEQGKIYETTETFFPHEWIPDPEGPFSSDRHYCRKAAKEKQ
jgi:hypothetical protein